MAIVGAGGIGFDVAVFITHNIPETGRVRETFLAEWGIDASYANPGGLSSQGPRIHSVERQVYLLQRKGSKIGKDLRQDHRLDPPCHIEKPWGGYAQWRDL